MLLLPYSVTGQNNYDTFLKQDHPTPNNYLKSIFKQKDIVVFCERDHPETTQYDFFYGLVSQNWFIENVGTIIIEVATQSIQKELDDYLINGNNTLLLSICRNNTHSPLWQKTNFHDFLKRIHTLNFSLKKEQRIRIIGADIPFNWSNIKNKTDLANFKNSSVYLNRDESMSTFIIDWYKKAPKIKNKALVIMNYRHSYGNLYSTSAQNSYTPNCYRFIRIALPEISTNVFLNRFTYSKFLGLRKKHGKGKWDKSFLKNDNKPLGFALKDSPFGIDLFDDYPYLKTDLKWQDFFDHFIFYNPINEFINSFGVKNLVDDSFKSELTRRYRLFGNKLSDKKILKINTIKTY
ncbi:hypothetical protein BZG02_10880 [Labilibaculum filiforme]|uniref:Uncharacterized protein n=2 Tax=Labilibaculum filiforme TaxID=1940526 RepID=A0A2N3HXD2_9BACT|nr:hypothetical protein BZG02_10880 [Labilibaculum filiforme]